MTNPNDPWGQRPEDAPTEHLGPGKSGYGDPAHTTEYLEAYGTGAPSAYPPTEQYGGWGPGPNATREFPPYDSQWSAYQDSGAGQWPGPGVPPGGAIPPGAAPPGPPQPPRRNTGLWIALALGVVLLIGAIGVVAGVLLGGSDSDSADTAAASTAPVTTRSLPGTRTAPPTPPSGLPGVPGLGDVDGLGATMGTITANDAGTLTVSSVMGDSITVRTDANTQVIALSGTKVSDLAAGELVLIQGDKAPDGSIQAKIIIGTSLPGGGR